MSIILLVVVGFCTLDALMTGGMRRNTRKTGLYTYAKNEKVKRINARQKKLSEEE